MADEGSAPVLRNDDDLNNLHKIEDINMGFKERDIRTKARELGLKYVDLRNAPVNQDALRMTSWEDVEKTQAVPFDIIGKIVSVASVEPESDGSQEMIQSITAKGYDVDRFLCSAEGLRSVQRFFDNMVKQEEVLVNTQVDEDQVEDWKEIFAQQKQIFETGNGPEMLNTLNLQAARFQASDIHFQPGKDTIVVRMRRDGQLYEVMQMTAKQYLLLSGEIKREAGLKVNVTETPQDGNYDFTVNDRQVSVRVSDLPSKYGDSLVLRILDARNAIVELEKLGFSEPAQNIMLEKLKHDRGLILVTGPTGSGKTSTLYSCLQLLNTPEKKIITLEDPVEYELENIVQSEIQEDEGYTFAEGLRSVLRQDPDVIMVGEIRDKEAAEIGLQASLTGHLVLSTLHANSAVATIPRLLNMGVKPYILSAGIELIVAQRLVRKLCPECKKPAEIDAAEKEEVQKVISSLQMKGVEITEQKIMTAEGCEACAHTSYQGRIAIAEALPMSDELRAAIAEEKPEEELLTIAEKSGFIRIREDGIMKVLQGETTLEEVWKVLV